MKNNNPIRCVLISVHNPCSILGFLNKIYKKDINLLSTESIYDILTNNNINSTNISDYVQFPNIIINNINLLHPRIHAGVAGRRIKDHNDMLHNRVVPIDMICVDLIPFEKLIKSKNIKLKEIMKKIDIGNISLIKSSIINYEEVTIVINNYDNIIKEMNNNNNCITLKTKRELAEKAFIYVVEYEKKILDYLKKCKNII